MQITWNCATRNFHNEAIHQLLMMRCIPNTPSAMLLAQSAGRGKSTLPQAIGVVTRGVTLIIESTLSLSADQHSKMKQANARHSPIKSFHLD